jgi:hypothetical protein
VKQHVQKIDTSPNQAAGPATGGESSNAGSKRKNN